uniref:class I SAM-dependent methyltransferase n=1 Tax=Flavobacterium sp. TaxID=239 RepID=UPI0040486F86
MTIELETVSCGICNSEKGIELKNIAIQGNHVSILKCPECGGGYLSPRPQNLNDIYGEVYWESSPDAFPDTADIYMTNKVIKIKKIISDIEKYFSYKNKIKLLEVGAGDGMFLQSCPEKFQTFGTEYNESSIKYLKKKGLNNIFLGDIESVNFNKKFDAIILMHVIEHLKNPSGFLEKARELPTDDGIVIILCPNELNSIFAKISNIGFIAKYLYSQTNIDFKIENGIHNLRLLPTDPKSEHFYNQIMLQHLFYFNPQTLRLLLKHHNFIVTKEFPGEVLKKNSWIMNLIKNKFVNSLAKFFDMQEEIYIFAKKS